MRISKANAKAVNGDGHLEKLTILVIPEVAALLRNEAARRYREGGPRWPLGAIVTELVRKNIEQPAGEAVKPST